MFFVKVFYRGLSQCFINRGFKLTVGALTAEALWLILFKPGICPEIVSFICFLGGSRIAQKNWNPQALFLPVKTAQRTTHITKITLFNVISFEDGSFYVSNRWQFAFVRDIEKQMNHKGVRVTMNSIILCFTYER